MKYELVIQEDAEEDFRHARDWYQQIGQHLVFRLNTAIREKLILIRKNPNAYQRISISGLRAPVLKHFPYRLVYRVIDTLVIVVGFCHTSQDFDAIMSRRGLG